MAKVRLQARAVEVEDDSGSIKAAEEGHGTSFAQVVSEGSKPKPTRIPRYTGAIDVLTKVLKQQGLTGWYQVSNLPEITMSELTRYNQREWVLKLRRLYYLKLFCSC